MISSIFALAFLSGTAHQTSQPTTATPPVRVRRVCRVQERLGTILTRRVCRSADEWAEIDRAQGRITERDVDHARDHRRDSLWEPGDPGTP